MLNAILSTMILVKHCLLVFVLTIVICIMLISGFEKWFNAIGLIFKKILEKKGKKTWWLFLAAHWCMSNVSSIFIQKYFWVRSNSGFKLFLTCCFIFNYQKCLSNLFVRYATIKLLDSVMGRLLEDKQTYFYWKLI